MKIVLMGFIIVLLVLSCGLAVRYGQDASYAQKELDGERYKRMTIEEGMQKANNQISTLKGQLKRTTDKVKNIEVVLEKTRAMNADLRARLDKAALIKVSLDKKISELQQMASSL